VFPTDATCFISLCHISCLTLQVSGLLRSIIKGIVSWSYVSIWYIQCLLTVRVPWKLVRGDGLALVISLTWRNHRDISTAWPLPQTSSQGTQTVNKHCMTQMVALQHLTIPLTMGWRRSETCRVTENIWYKDIQKVASAGNTYCNSNWSLFLNF
jgi:hypothetical protein